MVLLRNGLFLLGEEDGFWDLTVDLRGEEAETGWSNSFKPPSAESDASEETVRLLLLDTNEDRFLCDVVCFKVESISKAYC